MEIESVVFKFTNGISVKFTPPERAIERKWGWKVRASTSRDSWPSYWHPIDKRTTPTMANALRFAKLHKEAVARAASPDGSLPDDPINLSRPRKPKS